MRTQIDKRKLPEARENASDKITFGLSFICISLIFLPSKEAISEVDCFSKDPRIKKLKCYQR